MQRTLCLFILLCNFTLGSVILYCTNSVRHSLHSTDHLASTRCYLSRLSGSMEPGFLAACIHNYAICSSVLQHQRPWAMHMLCFTLNLHQVMMWCPPDMTHFLLMHYYPAHNPACLKTLLFYPTLLSSNDIREEAMSSSIFFLFNSIIRTRYRTTVYITLIIHVQQLDLASSWFLVTYS